MPNLEAINIGQYWWHDSDFQYEFLDRFKDWQGIVKDLQKRFQKLSKVSLRMGAPKNEIHAMFDVGLSKTVCSIHLEVSRGSDKMDMLVDRAQDDSEDWVLFKTTPYGSLDWDSTDSEDMGFLDDEYRVLV